MFFMRNKLAALLVGTCVSGSVFSQDLTPEEIEAASAAAAASTPVATPAPTLWNMLGVPTGMKKVRGALTNRRGNTPGLEPKPGLKALNDPANLESPVPAIKKAAEIKQEEDLAPQKIKTVKYLTSIGCGCYDADGSVTDALVAAAESCSETVRLATVEAIHEAAEGRCCSDCGQTCCCNEKLSKKLAELAYDKDDTGCYKEPSERVRKAAELALHACCQNTTPPTIQMAAESGSNPDAPATPKIAPETAVRFSIQNGEIVMNEVGTSPLPMPNDNPMSLVSTQQGYDPGQIDGLTRMQRLLAFSPHVSNMISNPQGGIVMAFDGANGIAYVQFEDLSIQLYPGMKMQLASDPRFGYQPKGLWEVVEAAPGQANLRPLVTQGCEAVKISDHAFFAPQEQVAMQPEATLAR